MKLAQPPDPVHETKHGHQKLQVSNPFRMVPSKTLSESTRGEMQTADFS